MDTLNYQRGNNVVAIPVDACTADSITTAGPDRITQYGYDDASQRTSVIEAYGVTGVQRTAQTLSYGLDSQLLSFTDAKGNKTVYTYGRLSLLAMFLLAIGLPFRGRILGPKASAKDVRALKLPPPDF
jgi:YD repeat-containing protein